jgi:tRNA-splicing ligase RtcB
MPTQLSERLWSWATDVEPATVAQAHRAASLPVVHGHVALMPDAHVGIGATVGSVIPTAGALIPSAVGVDLGCGMAAARTDLTASDLPDDLGPLLGPIEAAVPAGVGAGHRSATAAADAWFAAHPAPGGFAPALERTARTQFGTLGSGNHFVELCLDERDRVWLFLHSGSRGVGNQLAQQHIAAAKELGRHLEPALQDPDLAWFVQGTEAFDRYVADMLWSQDYARANREAMLSALASVVFGRLGRGRVVEQVNCHHNYATREVHDGVEVWVTRKGAISARQGELGLVPGSMGTRSYVVRGRGNPVSWQSCSHGAGRRLSRTAARKAFRPEDLHRAMAGRAWQADRAAKLIDEIPAAYKDIDAVMAAQDDLVEVVHELRQVLNYKGT